MGLNMCLAIPAKIENIDDDRLASVDVLGVKRQAALDLIPQAQIGDYILVHAGYGIEVVSEQHAQETLDLINEFPELFAQESA
jgi:hydrogenase expression/formation protein HypC